MQKYPVRRLCSVSSRLRHCWTENRSSQTRVRLVEVDGQLSVGYAGAQTAEPAGRPDLPALPVWVEIPADARVVGLSAMADALPLAVALARRLKERDPGRVVILGGWGPTTVARPRAWRL